MSAAETREIRARWTVAVYVEPGCVPVRTTSYPTQEAAEEAAVRIREWRRAKGWTHRVEVERVSP